MLATSREGLAVDGERMSGRCARSPCPTVRRPDVVAASDAACAVRRPGACRAPGFELDATNAAAVAEICRRLDGIPLAIELAAARVVAMSPGEIAARLDERFRLLTGGRAPRSSVTRRCAATVDWSYSAARRRPSSACSTRLGVFAGTLRRRGRDGGRVTRRRRRGVGRDRRDRRAWWRSRCSSPRTAPTARPATAMLETLRVYAREQLDEIGDTDGWRRRHAEHYAEFAESVCGRHAGPDDRSGGPLVAELDNLRAAVTWALDRDDPDDRGTGGAHDHRPRRVHPGKPVVLHRQHGGPALDAVATDRPNGGFPIVAAGLVPRDVPTGGPNEASSWAGWRCATAIV